jgi:membrane protease YdiL (CAAX protease family)
MSANSSDKLPLKAKIRKLDWRLIIVLPLWVLIGFGISQVLLLGLVRVLVAAHVPLGLLNPAVLNTAAAALVYVLSIAIVIGVPWWLKKYRTTKEDVGLTRLPSWMDILLAPAGFAVYFLCSALLVYAIGALFPGFNINEAQNTGFSGISRSYEYMLAFATLVVIAPIAEEALFRGYLYGKLRKIIPVWVAIPLVSAIFGFVHGQWNVAIDVFALSVILCILREITGSIWAGILLHMLKNGLAFYLLFINPVLLRTIGG